MDYDNAGDDDAADDDDDDASSHPHLLAGMRNCRRVTFARECVRCDKKFDNI